MALSENENPLGFVDKRKVQGDGNTRTATEANYVDVTALRARLTAISAGTYTAAVLNTMTKNDMVYAVRLNDDLTGV
jgi:hypothetical protein